MTRSMRRRQVVAGALVAATILGLAEGALSAPQTALVSRNGPDGAAGNAASNFATDITADGRYVVFATSATDLRPPSASDPYDIVLRDTATGVNELISVPNGADGVASPFGNGTSSDPSISDDGRYVVWTDTATNLLPGHTLSAKDRVWQRDRQTNQTKMVSARSGTSGLTAASDPDGSSNEGEISRDGTVVVFSSDSTNLGPSPDPNALYWDVFVRLVDGGAGPSTGLVSTDELLGDSGGDSREPTIDNASLIYFRTTSTQMGDPSVRFKIGAAGNEGGSPYIVDRLAGGGSYPAGDSSAPSISSTGSFAFVTNSADLGAPSGGTQIIRTYPGGAWVSTQVARSTANGAPNGVSGRPSISPDGNRVSFESAASNLVADDTNGVSDIFVVDLPSDDAQRVSVTTAGAQANGASTFSRTTNGAVGATAFQSSATNLAPITAATNTFVRETVTAAPTATTAPVLSGSGDIGQPMSCTLGGWSGHPVSFVYAWLVANVVVGGQTTSQYTIQPADGGKQIRCRVTATNAAGSTPALSNIRIAGAPAPPVATQAPGMTGTPKVGNTLTCVPGAFTGVVDTRSYRWLRSPGNDDFSAIDGAVGTTYVVQAADAGSRVRCEDTATNAGGSDSAVSPFKTAAADVPVNTLAPSIQGEPRSGAQQQCVGDSWANGVLQYSRRWLRNGEPIGGATSAQYTPVAADTNQQLSCEVTATNDVGNSAPAASASIEIFSQQPTINEFPVATQETTGPRPTDRRLSCTSGTWYDDGRQYAYEWQRDRAAIPGAAQANYAITVDDLGRDLRCAVRNTNPLGTSLPAASNTISIPLPPRTAGADARLYTAGGAGPYDPVNFLAASKQFREALDAQRKDEWQASLALFFGQCRSRGFNDEPDDLGATIFTASDTTVEENTCERLLDAKPEDIVVAADGVRITPPGGTCMAGPLDPCQPLPIPNRLATLDPGGVPADVVPEKVLWDVNGDDHVDGVCPGSAPVLRTLYTRGYYNVRAIMVLPRSVQLGIYPQLLQSFKFYPTATQTRDFTLRRASLVTDIYGTFKPFSAGVRRAQPRNAADSDPIDPYLIDEDYVSFGVLRKAQPFVCRKVLEPPQETTRPCLTEAWMGKVHVTGSNLCPVSVRKMPADEDLLLPASVRKLLGDAARSAFQAEVDANRASASNLRALRRERELAVAALDGDGAAYGALVTQFAQNPNTPSFDIDKVVSKEAQKNFTANEKEKLAASLDQIYVSKAPVKINGVLSDPLGSSAVVFVPSDVARAEGSVAAVKSLAIAASKQVSSLTNAGDLVKLSNPIVGDAIKATIADAKSAGAEQLKKLDLDALTESIKNTLKLGPFQLAGIGDVKLADGIATITAFAELPSLETDGAKARATVTIKGDLAGNLKLQGINLKIPKATLGALYVSDLDLTYDGGLDVKGKLLFPPLNQGVDIKRFRVRDNGKFEALDMDYLAGAGQGIPIGGIIPVYLTSLGGGLTLLDNDQRIEARATISVGPSPGGGCPTAGGQGHFRVQWVPEPFTVTTGTDIQVACVPLGRVDLKATSDGYVSLTGHVGFRGGPAYVEADVGAAFLLPNWTVFGDGSGGIDDVFRANASVVMSNRGFAMCGRGKLLDLDTGVGILDDIGDATEVAAGASVNFPGGVPPLNIIALIANLETFWGCDISGYKTIAPRAASAQAEGSRTVSVAAGENSLVLQVEGQGAAPRVALKGPDGTTVDLGGEAAKAKVPKAFGVRMEDEDKAVFIVGKPAAGAWQLIPAAGSPAIVGIRRAEILPKPQVTGKLGGAGSSRILRYSVAKIPGQVVRLYEQAVGGGQLLKKVTGGGKGTIRFTTAEALGTKRTIVAQVEQDGRPRTVLTVARFSAPNPKLARAKVRVRRAGSRAVVTWSSAVGAARYKVAVAVTDGRRLLLLPKGRARRVVVPRVSKRHGVTARVVGLSPKGRRGPAAVGRLRAARTKKPPRSSTGRR